MRYLFGFLCVCALSVVPLVGCSEGGSGGTDLCEGVTCDDTECKIDGVCDASDGMCDYTPVADGAECGDDAGTCRQGNCKVACTEQGIRDAIAAGGGPYTFACGDGMTVVTEAEIVIDNDVMLDGEGNLTVDGDGQHRVFLVAEGVTAELRGLTVARGATTSSEGGGISNRGRLTLTNSTVSENSTNGRGGGIYSGGKLTLMDSTVSGNTAKEEAGGIFNSYGVLTLTNSTVSGNSIVTEDSNQSWREDESIVNLRGTLTLTNSTVSGWIYAEGGPGEEVATNVSTATVIHGTCLRGGLPDEEVAWISNGYNIDTSGSCGFDQGTDQAGVTMERLRLGPLADNGGPTMTHALLAGSDAINRIPAVDCVDADGERLTTDQRGQPRPETGGTMCDVGAFEVQP